MAQVIIPFLKALEGHSVTWKAPQEGKEERRMLSDPPPTHTPGPLPLQGDMSITYFQVFQVDSSVLTDSCPPEGTGMGVSTMEGVAGGPRAGGSSLPP